MKRKTAILVISYLSAAVVALGVICRVYSNQAASYKRYTEANYQHAFDELVTSMTELDAALQKSLYVSSSSMAGPICTEVFGKAMTAQMALGVLPFSTQELVQTASFISKVGDYAFVLSRSAAGGKSYSDEERESLKALSETAELLAQNLRQMQMDIADGVLSMDELKASEDRVNQAEDSIIPASLGDTMRLIEQEFPEMPTLIYDGPFSEHVSGIEPKMLEGLQEIDENAARGAAAKFLGIQKGRVYPAGECQGNIPCYCMAAQLESGDVTLSVSRQGGIVFSMLTLRSVPASRISADDALAAARKFIEKRGYASMAESYFMIANNIMTANFAYSDNSVICYSDLIKVSVAMDTGEVIGFEAHGYVTAHYDRQLSEPGIPAEQVRGSINSELEVISEQLAVIPTEGKYEYLCYEFVCNAPDDKHYILYFDAETGDQRKILILLEDESGSLTI